MSGDKLPIVERLRAACDRKGKPSGAHMIDGQRMIAKHMAAQLDDENAQCIAEVADCMAHCIENEALLFECLKTEALEAATTITELVSALENAREALSLGAQVSLADPYILVELRTLCERAGYGNVMSSASALWRDRLDDLAGGEFCAGPCRATAENAIAQIDTALSNTRGDKNEQE